MEPITRVRTHRGFFYDIAGTPNTDLLGGLSGSELYCIRTIYGQVVFVNPSHVEAVEDLRHQPKTLEAAWEAARSTRKYQGIDY
jgi:hypothetical protein